MTSSTLTRLGSIRQFEKTAPAKYYALARYAIGKQQAGIYSTATVSGKWHTSLNYAVYVVLPIWESEADTAAGECSYWLGNIYTKTISNRLSDAEKKAKFHVFYESVQRQLDTTAFEHFTYLEKMGNNNKRDACARAVQKSRLVTYKDPVIFTAHDGLFANRSGNTLGWFFLAAGIGAVVWFLLLLCFELNRDAVNNAWVAARLPV